MRHEIFTPGRNAFRSLTQEEELWVAEYLSCLDARKASRRLGFSKSKSATAASWVKPNGPKPHVFRAVQNGLRARTVRLGVTADAVVQELARLGFSNMMNYIDVDPDGNPRIELQNLTADTSAAIKKITVEEYKEGRGENAREIKRITLELHDKKAPLIALGKYLGVFGEGPGGEMRSNKDAEELGADGQVGATQQIVNFNIQMIPSGQHFQGADLVPQKTIEGELVGEKEDDDA